MGKDERKVAGIILDCTEGFEAEKYRLGHTKGFFRAGALALLEEKRDDIVIQLIRYIQGCILGRNARIGYKKRATQRGLVNVLQRKFRQYLAHKSWGWFIIIQKTR